MDENQLPTKFYSALRRLARVCGANAIDNIEKMFLQAAKFGRCVPRKTMKFQCSTSLTALRRTRNTSLDPELRKQLSFQIRKQHKQEISEWETKQLQEKLRCVSCWRALRDFDAKIPGMVLVQQPQPDDFAEMLAGVFSGNPSPPIELQILDEPLWTLFELKAATNQLKTNRCADDVGLVAEILQCVPDN